MTDPDLARLFENTFPSTTDTTVKWHTDGTESPDQKTNNKKKLKKQKKAPGKQYRPGTDPDDYYSSSVSEAWTGPQSFIITGDIIASWLRDSTNQLRPYQPLAKTDKTIYNLILGAINTQAEYVIQSPYCNAFQPPPISGLRPSANGQDDVVHPAYEPGFVFECKYELDSLAHFLALANEFHAATGKADFLSSNNGRWRLALETLLGVLEEQSRGTFEPETGRYRRNEYTFQRNTNTGTETLSLMGNGNPLAEGTGLVRSAFRPSDDATILGFFVPANAMMAVELRRTAGILADTGEKEDAVLAGRLEKWSQRITDGIWEYGVVKHRTYGDVFAYEVDGYGSSILMDDANYPSLLALPLMGFVGRDDPTYKNTRRMLLEKKGNPYYLTGREFRGIGGEFTRSCCFENGREDTDDGQVRILGCRMPGP
jgi:meiotically up-regulated gene 157 (Mug157) protein